MRPDDGGAHDQAERGERGGTRRRAPPMTLSAPAGGDIAGLTAGELAALYAARRLSPVEATRAILDRIASLNTSLNAFAFLDGEAALADARRSEARWTSGIPSSPIDGVPVTLKDTLLAKDTPTLCGSLAIEPGDEAWDIDSPVAARLREAGAVLLGKTTMSEFGVKAVTETTRHGVTRNPWNLAFSPGGSSGGAAAAAAAGFGPLHVSTDGGGSARVPAALTGVLGFMPTFGRIAQFPANYQGTRFHIGINTRSVADAARLLSVLARPDARDWDAIPADVRDWSDGIGRGVAGLRIAFSPTLGRGQVDARVAAAVEHAARLFADLGAAVECIDPQWPAPDRPHRILGSVAMARLVDGIRPERRARLDPSILRRAEEGRGIGALDHVRAMEERAALGRHMLRFHQRFDLLVAPVTRFAAIPVGGGDGIGFEMTNVFNMTHQPACAVPCGLLADGLPVALQIVGRKYGDADVLAAAHAFEAVRPFVQVPAAALAAAASGQSS